MSGVGPSVPLVQVMRNTIMLMGKETTVTPFLSQMRVVKIT